MQFVGVPFLRRVIERAENDHGDTFESVVALSELKNLIAIQSGKFQVKEDEVRPRCIAKLSSLIEEVDRLGAICYQVNLNGDLQNPQRIRRKTGVRGSIFHMEDLEHFAIRHGKAQIASRRPLLYIQAFPAKGHFTNNEWYYWLTTYGICTPVQE